MNENISKVYQKLLTMGYPQRFCHLISSSLGTDFTTMRMMGYLSKFEDPPSMEEVTDEMLAILSDRDRIREKKINEHYNAKWNDFMRREVDEEE